MTGPAPARLLVATTNRGKLAEIRDILGGTPTTLATLDDHPGVGEPEETGATFAANARLKALYYAEATGELTVAEDSGLEIDALDGEPGVRSARFNGESYAEKFAAIRRMLAERGADGSAPASCARSPSPAQRRLTAPPGAQPTLQEPAPFHGANSWPAHRRLTAPPGAQPTLQESAPFHGANSWPAHRRLTAPPSSGKPPASSRAASNSLPAARGASDTTPSSTTPPTAARWPR